MNKPLKIELKAHEEIHKELIEAHSWVQDSFIEPVFLRIFWQTDLWNYDDEGSFVMTAPAGWYIYPLLGELRSNERVVRVGFLDIIAPQEFLEDFKTGKIIKIESSYFIKKE